MLTFDIKDTDHPYYCSEFNYYSNEPGQTYDSWEEFLAEWGDNDKDYNLLFRWDWHKPDSDNEQDGHELELFYVLQRKGIFLCNTVHVTEDDAPAVTEFLHGYWTHMKKLWDPFT